MLIDQKLSLSNDSQSLVPFVNNGDVVVEPCSSSSMPPLNRCGSIQTDDEEGLLFNISSFKIDQFKGKSNYHANSVQRVYSESGLQQPDPNQNRQSQFKITARHNFYVTREAELTQEMQK